MYVKRVTIVAERIFDIFRTELYFDESLEATKLRTHFLVGFIAWERLNFCKFYW